jgi:hypothetical protein
MTSSTTTATAANASLIHEKDSPSLPITRGDSSSSSILGDWALVYFSLMIVLHLLS